MNIKSVILWLVLILVGLGCDDDPVIDQDKFGKYYLIMAEITPHQTPLEYTHKEYIRIRKMRYLVDLAFSQEDSCFFEAENCEVILSGEDTTYRFEYENNGNYVLTLTNSTGYIAYGEECKLDVTFEDGSHAYSFITTPKITFPNEKDTIYVTPDSVLEWHNEWGARSPFTVTSINYQDTIQIQLGDETIFNSPNTTISFNERFEFQEDTSNYIWFTYRLVNDCLLISSATASPARFAQKHPIETIEIYFWAEHCAYRKAHVFHYNDPWPIRNIAEISNINGAYGIFTSGRYNISKKFILKVKE
jgi:hypothetical protein